MSSTDSKTTISSRENLPALAVRALDGFAEIFSAAATHVAFAPGRVNLIGEHTDYNDGFVLPMAIDRWTAIALRPRTDERVVLHSLDVGKNGEFSLRDLTPGKVEGWLSYAGEHSPMEAFEAKTRPFRGQPDLGGHLSPEIKLQPK